MDKIESDCISVIFRINYYDLMIMCALFQNYKALQFDNNKDKRKISFSQVNNSAKKKHLELEKKEENSSPVVSKENNFKELNQSNVHKIKATQEKESKSNYCSFNFIEPTQALVRDESSDDTDDDDDDDAPAATADKKEVKPLLADDDESYKEKNYKLDANKKDNKNSFIKKYKFIKYDIPVSNKPYNLNESVLTQMNLAESQTMEYQNFDSQNDSEKKTKLIRKSSFKIGLSKKQKINEPLHKLEKK